MLGDCEKIDNVKTVNAKKSNFFFIIIIFNNNNSQYSKYCIVIFFKTDTETKY